MRAARAIAIAGALVAGCSDQGVPDATRSEPGTTVAMDFTGKGGFYASPFPSDTRVTGGRVDVSDFPNPDGNDLVKRVLSILDRADGFGTTSGIFFRISGAIRTDDLPDLHGTMLPGSPVALIELDAGATGALRRVPISTAFLADGGPYGAPNLLVLLPLQGVPLRPHTRYAAVVLRDLRDARGKELGASSEMASLVDGVRPAGMDAAAFDSYQAALHTLAGEFDVTRLAGLAVFTTGAPVEEMARVTSAMVRMPMPAPSAPFAQTDLFGDYCVYETTVAMPEYQEGVPPYSDTGGGWVFDAAGEPVLQRTEQARFVVTVPRRPMPPAGFPVVVFSRTGGGGERPLVDRGTQGVDGGAPLEPGTGPASFFARAGFGGSSIDGPHGGLRNVTHGDEQFLMFNVGNPVALRDNVRQSAAELALEAHLLEAVEIDTADCPGATSSDGKARFDPSTMALMGHSMGATIAPLTLAVEPSFRAGLLSGAGGSWIENVIYKQKPLPVKGIAEVLIGIAGSGYSLSEHDPVLSLFQWAGESADPPVYADGIVRAPIDGPPRHILMMQGIVDHYILPSIANATSLSLGLDLAGEELDGKTAELASFSPLGNELDLVGRGVVALPASGNVTAAGAKTTAIVVQHLEDGIEDGHEVVFQTEAPKHEYRCFLEGLAKGLPTVPGPGQANDPCE